MLPLVLLAVVMAVFGVLGYQRGTRAALLNLCLTLLGLMIVGRLGDRLIGTINGLGKGLSFVASGGLSALSGEGNAEQAFQSLRTAPALVTTADTGPVLALIFVLLVVLGFLLARLPFLKGRPSVLGLLQGLASGYFIGAIVLRALLPETSSFLVLPFGLGRPAGGTVATGGITAAGALDRGLSWATSAVRPQTLAIVLAVLIALFVLLATRGGGSGKKG